MNVLALDTSTEQASVGLYVNGKLWIKVEKDVRQHAQVLLNLIEHLFLEANFSLSHLDAIAFGRGPGSFTGIRVACSVAKGLAMAHQIPLYGISTLQTIAHSAQAINNDVPILVLLDARMNQIYWAYFSTLTDYSESVSDPDKISIPSKPLVIAGVNYETYYPLLPSTIRDNALAQHVIYPCAKSMIELVRANKIKAVSIEDAVPIYIRDDVTHQKKLA